MFLHASTKFKVTVTISRKKNQHCHYILNSKALSVPGTGTFSGYFLFWLNIKSHYDDGGKEYMYSV